MCHSLVIHGPCPDWTMGVRGVPHLFRDNEPDEASDAEGNKSELGQVALISGKVCANYSEAEDRSSSRKSHDCRGPAVYSLSKSAGSHAGIFDWNEIRVWKLRLQIAGVLR